MVVEQQGTGEARRPTISIGVHRTTKARLDKNRAPGQCYVAIMCTCMETRFTARN